MGVLRKAIDIVLYTNVWIAGAAMALYIYTNHFLTGNLVVDNTALFLLANSTWLYSLHRFIGLQKVGPLDKEDRFYKIAQLKTTIFVVSAIAFIISIVLFFQLSKSQIIILLIPGALSLLYVLPIFKNGKRLRDLHFVKIFVISFVWAILTVVLPASSERLQLFDKLFIVLFLERFLYIFAITLPFDIRDLEVDQLTGVKTIANLIGKNKTLYLSLFLLISCSLLMCHLSFLGQLSTTHLFIHIGTNLITYGLIGLATHQTHDWFFTGGIDGAMYIPLLLLLFLN